jgi:hypothetical protein
LPVAMMKLALLMLALFAGAHAVCLTSHNSFASACRLRLI